MKFISYKEKRNGKNHLIRRYKVYNFLLFKIKKKVLPVLGENNKIIIGERELTENDKKLLDTFGKIRIEGNNNIVELPDFATLKCNINIRGNNNIVKLPFKNNLQCSIELEGNSNKIYIGRFTVKTEKTNLSIDARGNYNNREVKIEDSKYFMKCHLALRCNNNSKIYIGKDCMFSSEINIWTTDSRPIFDLETKERVNEEQDIIIGDHVWVGREVFVAKGSVIPSGSVIGAKAFVNKAFTKKNCIIAGIPAKVVKENIHWEC